MMKEEEYYKEIYSRFWLKQTKKYGLEKYVKFIIMQILKSDPNSVFEVGIGTGWPVASMLQKKKQGIQISGCDIAEILVEEAKRTLNIEDGIYTGGLLDLNIQKEYDTCYCVRTSWYISDFQNIIKEMIRTTKKDGYVIFDIMDSLSLYHLKLMLSEISDSFFKWIGIEVEAAPKLKFYSARKMRNMLKNQKLPYVCYGERQISKSKDFFNTPKKLFICKITGKEKGIVS